MKWEWLIFKWEISSRRQTTSMGEGFDILRFVHKAEGIKRFHKEQLSPYFHLGLGITGPLGALSCLSLCFCVTTRLLDQSLIGKEVSFSLPCFRVLLVYLAFFFGSHDLWNNKCHLMLCAILNSLSGFKSGAKILSSSSDLKLSNIEH